MPGDNLYSPGRACSSGAIGTWSEGIYFNPTDSCPGYALVTFLADPDRMRLEVKDEFGVTQVEHVIDGPMVEP